MVLVRIANCAAVTDKEKVHDIRSNDELEHKVARGILRLGVMKRVQREDFPDDNDFSKQS